MSGEHDNSNFLKQCFDLKNNVKTIMFKQFIIGKSGKINC